MRYINYAKTLENESNKITILSLIVYKKMREELIRIQSELKTLTRDEKIRWIKWDKEKFNKQLLREIKSKWHMALNLDKYWQMVLKEFPMLYIQQDFMGNAYGYTYSCKKDKYRDYGNVVFYANYNGLGDEYSKELLEHWFDKIVIPKYKKRYGKISNITKKREVYQTIYLIYDAILHFDKNITKERLDSYIFEIALVKHVRIKSITDQELIF